MTDENCTEPLREQVRSFRGRIAELEAQCLTGRQAERALRASEAALRRGEEKYRTLVESAGEAISTIGADGRFLFMNSTGAERLGGTVEDFVGKTMWDLFPPEIADRQMASIRQVIEARRPEVFETPTILKGQTRWYRTSLAPLRGPDDRVSAVLMIGRDITAFKQAQEAARAATRKLVSAREEERRHVARELHDSLGQQLVAARFAIQGVLADLAGSPDAGPAEKLRRVSEGCRRMVHELRRISQGLYPPTLESLGLAVAIQDLASGDSPGTEVVFTCDPSAEGERFGDAVEIALFRIAQESLSNALRHSGARRIELSLTRDDGQLLLDVLDDGKGFVVQSAVGGLGLTTMSERAGAVGGDLEITSRKGRTRVRVRVPPAGGSPEPAQGSPATDERPPKT